jgi:LacI family transcriptional regulator
MRPVTLQEVARHAGVSQATASRVLNGSLRVPGPGVAEQVRKAAAELGYVPNAQAQALARSSSGLIGLVVREISDPYFSSIARGVQRIAREHDRHVLLSCTEADPAGDLDAVTSFISLRADALIMVGSRSVGRRAHDRLLNSELKRYTQMGGRIAVIGQATPLANSVVPQNREGAAALADALVRQGHRRFAVFTGPTELQTAVDRAVGFSEALSRHGVEPLATVPRTTSWPLGPWQVYAIGDCGSRRTSRWPGSTTSLPSRTTCRRSRRSACRWKAWGKRPCGWP